MFSTEQAYPPREPSDAQSPQGGRLKSVRLLQIARSDGEVRPGGDLVSQRTDISGVVLAVTVKLYVDVIAALAGVEVPSLDGAADAEVAREIKDVEPMLPAERERSISRSVVYDDVVIPGRNDVLHYGEDGVLLVVGRYNNENAQKRASIHQRVPSSYYQVFPHWWLSVKSAKSAILLRSIMCHVSSAVYAVWNGSMDHKKILIISEFIAPVRAVASIRWSSYAKYLARDFGYEVTVLTNQKCFDGSDNGRKPYQYDASLESNLEWFEIAYIPSSMPQTCANAFFNLGYHVLEGARKSAVRDSHQRGASRSQTQRMLKSSFPERVFELVDGSCGKAFVSAGLKADIDFSSFDVMISTYGPIWPHRLAKIIKKRHPHICWIADFRDPLVRSRRTNTPKRRALAGLVTEGADCVTTVSRGFVDGLYLPESRRVAVLDNGFDVTDASDDLGQSEKGPGFRLVYTGTLYSDDTSRQDMSPLFQSLERLIDAGEVDSADVTVEYAGKNSDLFLSTSSRFPRVSSVDHGLVPRDVALDLQRKASVLIVCAWNTSEQKGVLTAKIYEYMQQDAPIVGLCCGEVPHSDLRSLIESSFVGMCHEEADSAADSCLDDYLLGLYQQWKVKGRALRDPRSVAGVMSYSYPELTKKLVALIEELKNE